MYQPHQIRLLDNSKKITLKSYKSLLITPGKIFEKQKKFRVLFNTNNSANHTYFVNSSLCFLVSATLFCRFLSFHTLVGHNSNHLHCSFHSNLHYFKTNKTQQSRIFLKLHIFGNLFAFLVVSIHFAQNLARLAGFLQRLGDGLALYYVLLLIVTTGILERY